MLKSRKMHVDVDQRLPRVLGVEHRKRDLFEIADDPRATRVGRSLRSTSLDELPQLVNALRDEMSIVGPRSERPFVAAQHEAWQHKRTALRPGLTGWWRVNGCSDLSLHQNLENDPFRLDLCILDPTIGAVLRGRGTY